MIDYPPQQTQPSAQQTAARQRPRRQPQPHKRVSALLLLFVFGAVGVLLMLCMVSSLFAVYLSQTRIPPEVTVAGVAVGGTAPEDAAAQLQRELSNPQVTFADGVRTWTITWFDLGISIDYAATAQAAVYAERGAALDPVISVELNQTQTALVYLSDLANITPVAASIDNPAVEGRAVDIPVLLDALRVDALGELRDGRVELPMIVIAAPEPEAPTRVNYTGETTTHLVERGQELGLIAKRYGVSVEDISALNGIANPDLIYVGQELTIPADGVYTPSSADAPAPSTTTGRALTISISQQRIFAWENGQIVHSHLVSTGLPQTPTVLGDYNVYVKLLADDMSGADYFLPQVPYTMYFFQGYAIHGTYWHNAFGRPMSHGCVNLPVQEAEWFFNFAQVGTPVRVVQ